MQTTRSIMILQKAGFTVVNLFWKTSTLVVISYSRCILVGKYREKFQKYVTSGFEIDDFATESSHANFCITIKCRYLPERTFEREFPKNPQETFFSALFFPKIALKLLYFR